MKKSRNRVIYQSESIYVSDDIFSTSNLNHCELIRIQSSNYGFTMNKTDVNQYGLSSRIDSILDLPTVNFDFSYYLSDGQNEKALGFNVEESFQFSKKHIEDNNGFNLYILTSDEGLDSVDLDYGDDISIMGIGNVFITNYSVDLSVGSLPTVNVSCEGSNINCINTVVSGEGTWGTDIYADVPSINMENARPYSEDGYRATLCPPYNTGQGGPTALKPRDITLTFEGLDGVISGESISKTSGNGSFHLQSANLSIPMPREELRRLGTKGVYARVVEYPIRATLSVNAILSNIETVDLAQSMRRCHEGGFGNRISISANDCENQNAIKWTLIKPVLLSENFSSNIGPSKSVDLVFEVDIGDSEDVSVGIICDAQSRYRPKEACPVSDQVPTRVYGYDGYDGNAESASGIFSGPSNVIIDYTFDTTIPYNWKMNNPINPPYPQNPIYGPHDNLRSIAFGGLVDTIGESSFEHLEITGQLFIPQNITGMGNKAFRNCDDLESLVIDANLLSISQGAFQGCTSLTSVTTTNP
jgi:hypothetical protein